MGKALRSTVTYEGEPPAKPPKENGEAQEAREMDELRREAAGLALMQTFSGAAATAAGRRRVERFLVTRLDPAEGYLGELDTDATQEDLGARWGGGRYKIEALDNRGKYVDRSVMRIAGDPIFQSKGFARQWANRIAGGAVLDEATAAGAGEESVLDYVKKLMGDREADHRRSMERMKAETDDRIREMREWGEQSRTRDREFYAQLAKLSGAGAGAAPTVRDRMYDAMFLRALGGILKESEAGTANTEDPVVAAINAVPDALAEIREMYASGRGRSNGTPESRTERSARQKAALRKTARYLERIEKMGIDPEKAVDAAFRAVQQTIAAAKAAKRAGKPKQPEK